MKTIYHKSTDRGFADHGWLKANHSFSFANWHNPEKMQFGKIRVLNDDIISPGGGFGTHPHENMEIVTIPLEGAIAHKDNTGHEEIIKHNEVQVMSAGTGILHSEYNASESENANLFQVWIFPDKNGHQPRYNQKVFNPKDRENKLHTFVSPNKSLHYLWLNQDAYFSWSDLDADKSIHYNLHSKENGVYVLLIDGVVSTVDKTLTRRDAIGIWEANDFTLTAKENSSILFIEAPMN